MVWVGQNGVEGLTENLADALHSSTAQTIYCKVHLLGGGGGGSTWRMRN